MDRPRAHLPSGSGPSLVLGTAQVGLRYGIANVRGMPDEALAGRLFAAAFEAGIREVDTARAYGLAEERLGRALADWHGDPVAVATKLDPLEGVRPDDKAGAVAGAEASLAASLASLGGRPPAALLLHRARHRTAWDGAVWDLLRRRRDRGAVGRLGVSVATPAELHAALDDPDVEHVQLPFNLLDWRWHAGGTTERLRAARPKVRVHVRSVMLQGLLADAPGTIWPPVANVDPPSLLAELRAIARAAGFSRVAELAVAYARSQDWIDGVVIGAETQEQIVQLSGFFELPPHGDAVQNLLRLSLPRVPNELLDPTRWPHQ